MDKSQQKSLCPPPHTRIRTPGPRACEKPEQRWVQVTAVRPVENWVKWKGKTAQPSSIALSAPLLLVYRDLLPLRAAHRQQREE